MIQASIAVGLAPGCFQFGRFSAAKFSFVDSLLFVLTHAAVVAPISHCVLSRARDRNRTCTPKDLILSQACLPNFTTRAFNYLYRERITLVTYKLHRKIQQTGHS